MLFYSFYQTNYTIHDIKLLIKPKTLLHRLAEIAPATLCNIDMEISAIS